MRSSWKKTMSALALALSLGAAACGDDPIGPGQWTMDDLEGTWTVTRYEYTSDADPGDTFDLIDQGTSGTIVINANGNYTLTFDTPGLPDPVVTTGTFTVDANGNVVDSQEGGTINITRDGDTITIRDESAEFDFDGDDIDEDADLVVVWELQN